MTDEPRLGEAPGEGQPSFAPPPGVAQLSFAPPGVDENMPSISQPVPADGPLAPAPGWSSFAPPPPDTQPGFPPPLPPTITWDPPTPGDDGSATPTPSRPRKAGRMWPWSRKAGPSVGASPGAVPPGAVPPAAVRLADGSSAAAPSADNSAAISPAHPLRGRGTLSYQLVWRSTVLVAAVLIVVSGLWALSNQQILMQEIDNRLATALAQPFNGMMSSNATGAADNGGELIRVDVIGGMAYSQTQLDTTALSALMDVPAGAPATVDIPDLGDYRVLTGNQSGFRGGLASGVAGGSLTIVALPMSQVTGPMGIQLIVTSLLVLLAIGAVFAGTWVIVERSLRPLNRLAATADAVSVLPLETGEGVVPVRAGPADTNPRNEVGRVGQAFNHMLDNVESALAARHRSETKVRQFVADASHELRNPLAAIRGYAELTRRDRDVLPGQTAHALTRIEAESDRMSALVEDLLLLARLDSEPTMDLRPTDLPELVVDAVSDARAAGPDDHWLLELPDADVIVAADGNRLHQVVVNLLANARTHTPPGTTVVTRLFTEPGTAVIQVVDDGPGVPEAIQSTVFERFTRGDVSRVRRAGVSSTGLGLAIVQAVVTAHGGTVALDSHPGHTAFTVRLPLVPLAPSC